MPGSRKIPTFHVAAAGFLSLEHPRIFTKVGNCKSSKLFCPFFFLFRKITGRRDVAIAASPGRAASPDLKTQREAGSCSGGGSKRGKERVQEV